MKSWGSAFAGMTAGPGSTTRHPGPTWRTGNAPQPPAPKPRPNETPLRPVLPKLRPNYGSCGNNSGAWGRDSLCGQMNWATVKKRGATRPLSGFLVAWFSSPGRYPRCSRGTYSKSISPTYSVSGRIRMLSLYCSMHWTVQPGMRPRAKMEMNRSSGMLSR